MRSDVIVVGLGPAGSTAAYRLASAGLEVVALDKAVFPRYKSCGGCISTKVTDILDFDVSGVIEHEVRGATFTYKSLYPLDIISDRPVGYNVMRDRFDHLLVEKARGAGARIVEGARVCDVEIGSGGATVRTEAGGCYRGRVLVGADGASGLVGRRLFGMKPKEAAVSLTSEVPYDRKALAAETDGRLYIDFGSVPFGYGWIFPKERYLSVGMAGDTEWVGGRIKDCFDAFVSSHPLLRGFEVKERVGWTVPIYYDGAPPAVRDRALLVGDTGHLVDPFLGEGIYYAVKTAGAAADVIVEALGAEKAGGPDLRAYQEWIERVIKPEFDAADRLSDLIYRHPRLWFKILEKEPHIMLRYYDVIRGEWDCPSFYEWVYSKVRGKPFRALRRWIESRFMPA
ncbi:MAG TPA: geranylgeranyl reductase family protein [Deltaproteobacteria bacterium]|nr:geranylgeranyl reductase family protein [Deltaproteobacteria bacterium]